MPDDEMLRILDAPAYWAFCWGSGQALARYLLENPELIANKRVLDLGSGSGVAAPAWACHPSGVMVLFWLLVALHVVPQLPMYRMRLQLHTTLQRC